MENLFMGISKERRIEIGAHVEEIINKNNFFQNNCYDIMQLIEKEKVKVFEVEEEKWKTLTSDENVDAIIMINKKFGKNILVKSGLLDEDKRFNLAHELGHLYLHAKEGEPFFATMKHSCTGQKKIYEDEADYFAACLLMPKSLFIQLGEKIKYVNNNLQDKAKEINPIAFMAQSFGVSVKSVIRRCEELGVNFG